MQPTFSIDGASLNEIERGEYALYIDLAADHSCLALFHLNNRSFSALEYYDLEKKDGEHKQWAFLNTSKLARFGASKVVVAYNTPEALMIPQHLFEITNRTSALELMFGDLHHGNTLEEKLADWDLYTVYRVPSALHERIIQLFPQGQYWHFYSLLLRVMKNHMVDHAREDLKVVFYPNRVVTALVKMGQLQVVQSFEYEIAEDVAYYLLNICQQFQCDPNAVRLGISGLVEMDSPLYTELMKYFLLVHMDNRPEEFNYDPAFNDYPLHFFTPVFSLATCV